MVIMLDWRVNVILLKKIGVAVIAQEERNLLPCKRLVLVHDDDQALTINTISLPGGPRPRVDFFTTERSPNRDLGISKTRFHINIMSRWAKSLTRLLKNELSVLEHVTKLGQQSESLILSTNLTHHLGAFLPPACHITTLWDSFIYLMLKESNPC